MEKILKLPEKLEFGNPEHIKAVKQSEQRFDQLKKGIDLSNTGATWSDIDDFWISDSSFTCVCGSEIDVKFADMILGQDEGIEFPESIDLEPVGDDVQCYKCRREYEIDFPADGSEWQVKLIIEEE